MTTMGYLYSKVEIEGVGTFTVAKPVVDLLALVTGQRDGSRAEVKRLRAALYTIAHNLDVTPGQPPTLEDAQAVAEDALAR